MLNEGFDGMGILCVFCVYDTIGNRCFEKTSFPKNSVSNDLRSMFVDSINVFDCRISELFIEYRPVEYIARTIRNKGYYE